MKEQKLARQIQDSTGFTYTTSLNLVRGLIQFTPRSPDCLTQAALTAANVKPFGTVRICRCPRCDDGDD